MRPIKIPQCLDEVEPDWLEAVLDRGEKRDLALPEFRLEQVDADNSTTARLFFAEPPQDHSVPQTLFLKLCPAGHGFLGASEPNYYTRDYVGLTKGPLVNCYGVAGSEMATSDSVGAGYALLLQDLGRNFTDNKWIEPNKAHAANLGKALGQLHAHRWGRNADPEGPHDLEAAFQRYLSHVSLGLDPIFEAMSNDLDGAARTRLVRALGADAERMLARALTGKGLTLVHGDPNPTNVLTRNMSADASTGGIPLYLIDRQPFDWSLRVWLGASDLIYAVVPFWPESHRRAFQNTLLSAYHQSLLDNGVTDYSWEALNEDWKACACIAAFTAIEWGSDPASLVKMRGLWEKQLNRALVLLEDCDAGNNESLRQS